MTRRFVIQCRWEQWTPIDAFTHLLITLLPTKFTQTNKNKGARMPVLLNCETTRTALPHRIYRPAGDTTTVKALNRIP